MCLFFVESASALLKTIPCSLCLCPMQLQYAFEFLKISVTLVKCYNSWINTYCKLYFLVLLIFIISLFPDILIVKLRKGQVTCDCFWGSNIFGVESSFDHHHQYHFHHQHHHYNHFQHYQQQQLQQSMPHPAMFLY